MAERCKFDCGWAGQCKQPADDGKFCSKHEGLKCASCGERAVRECGHTGIQFCCGFPLCATCQHGLVPLDQPQGWFNLGGGHVTKEVSVQQWEAEMKRLDAAT